MCKMTSDLPHKDSEKTSEANSLKNLIPLSYMAFGALFLSLSFIFGFTFYSGIQDRGFLFGFWTNLMLLVGSIGLTVTVVAAIIDWRRSFGTRVLTDEEKAGE